MSIASMQRQLCDAQDALTELEKERAGLTQFLAQAKSDQATFEMQLVRKRGFSSKARTVARSQAAEGLAAMLDEKLGSGFARNVQGCFGGVADQTLRALDQVEGEIRQQRAMIASLEQGICDERDRLVREEEARVERERVSRLEAGS